MNLLLIAILLNSVSWRGSSRLLIARDFIEKPMWASSPVGDLIIHYYTLFVLPIAVINGYYIAGYKGFIIVGIGTIFGKMIVDELSNSFSYIVISALPTIQFILFAPLNIIFTINNCFFS